MTHIAGSIRPLTDLDELELRRHRLSELVEQHLVSSSLSSQLTRTVAELDRQIAAARQAQWERPMSIAA